MANKPRIRKSETVRERNSKIAVKANHGSEKRKYSKVGSFLVKIAKPFKFLAWPFTRRPVKFVFRWLGRILWPRYFRNSFREIRQVTWPSRKDTWKMTFAVIIFAIVFGAFAHLSDYGFDKIIKRIVFR